MDIARIRKRLKEAGEGRKPQTPEPVLPGGAAAFLAEPAIGNEKAAGEIEEQRDVTGGDVIKEPQAGEEAAPPGEHIPEAAPLIELLTFKLSGEEYAFRVSDVQEILLPHHVTSVPRTDLCVLGVISMRGKVIPVIDLKMRLFGSANGPVSKILILKGPMGSIGVTVDKGMDVIRVPEPDFGEPPAHLTGQEVGFIEGMVRYADRFISVFDMDGLLDFNFKAAPEG